VRYFVRLAGRSRSACTRFECVYTGRRLLLPRNELLNAILMSFERFMVSLMTVVVLVFDLHAHFITLDPQARSERSCAQRSSELAPEWLLQSALDTILRLLTKSGCSITH
jgi:hypothetical protein